VPFNSSWEQLKIDEGISGWVALHGVSLLVKDVEVDSRYRAYFSNARSELCAPLVDGEGRILGVLNVEHYQPAAFNSRHQRILEALANRDVVINHAARSKALTPTPTGCCRWC
jgi:GAF domain-containing protein